tara:strand:+ start:4754 stop:5140 length:387 start_codon:yes stop_codon:yes gene_type:complete
MTTQKELLALIPIVALATLYLGRDVLLFNQLQIGETCCSIKLTKTQKKVAIFIYPLWVFLVWIENVAQKNNNFLVVILLNISNTYIGWWTTVAIFNDSFTYSRQQQVSLIFSFCLSGLWRLTNILVFS